MPTAIELVTGHTGEPHVTAAQDARRNAGVVGAGRCVLATGDQLRCVVDSANQVTVLTGDAILDGRHVAVETPVPLAIDSGQQLANRNDLVCVHYAMDQQTGVESAELVVERGEASSGTATDPAVTQDSLLTGGVTETWWPLWRIPITGVSVGTPVLLADVVPTTVALGGRVTALENAVSPLPESVSSLQSRVAAMKPKTDVLGKTYDKQGDYAISADSIDSLVAGPSVSLPAGTYVITAHWTFSAASGNRVCQCAIGSAASDLFRRQRVVMGGGNFCVVECTCIRTLNAQATVRAYGSSSKKSSNANVRIGAVRIV